MDHNEPEINVVLVKKDGEVVNMPNLYVAKSYAEGIWVDQVSRIEVKQIYKYK